MSFTKHLQQTLQKEYAKEKDPNYDYSQLLRQKLIDFRKQEDAVARIERPSNLPRARSLGYKAKQGIIVARVRIRKGSGMHRRPIRGRKPKRMGVRKLTRRKSIQGIAEQRVARKFPNMEVLNSYWVGEDGQNKYFEVILVDPESPSILADSSLKWIAQDHQRGRAFRGLTSAQKKTRGLRKKGFGAEKVRPSQRAHDRKAK